MLSPAKPLVFTLDHANPNDFWSLSELCRVSGMSRGAVEAWIRKGRLPVYDIGGRLYVKPEEWAASPLRFRKPYKKHVRGWWREMVPAQGGATGTTP